MSIMDSSSDEADNSSDLDSEYESGGKSRKATPWKSLAQKVGKAHAQFNNPSSSGFKASVL
jgi:hypothetical protein